MNEKDRKYESEGRKDRKEQRRKKDITQDMDE